MNIQDFTKQALAKGYSQEQIQQYVSMKLSQTQQNPAQWGSFLQQAREIAKKNDFPLSVLAAQAALESARGKSAPGNNYFGIKGRGNAGSNYMSTQEATPEGQYYSTKSGFRAYKSPGDSIQDYIDLIRKNYPKAYAQRKDPAKMIAAIRAGGYATSPTYVQNVMSTPEFKYFSQLGL